MRPLSRGVVTDPTANLAAGGAPTAANEPAANAFAALLAMILPTAPAPVTPTPSSADGTAATPTEDPAGAATSDATANAGAAATTAAGGTIAEAAAAASAMVSPFVVTAAPTPIVLQGVQPWRNIREPRVVTTTTGLRVNDGANESAQAPRPIAGAANAAAAAIADAATAASDATASSDAAAATPAPADAASNAAPTAPQTRPGLGDLNQPIGRRSRAAVATDDASVRSRIDATAATAVPASVLAQMVVPTITNGATPPQGGSNANGDADGVASAAAQNTDSSSTIAASIAGRAAVPTLQRDLSAWTAATSATPSRAGTSASATSDDATAATGSGNAANTDLSASSLALPALPDAARVIELVVERKQSRPDGAPATSTAATSDDSAPAQGDGQSAPAAAVPTDSTINVAASAGNAAAATAMPASAVAIAASGITAKDANADASSADAAARDTDDSAAATAGPNSLRASANDAAGTMASRAAAVTPRPLATERESAVMNRILADSRSARSVSDDHRAAPKTAARTSEQDAANGNVLHAQPTLATPSGTASVQSVAAAAAAAAAAAPAPVVTASTPAPAVPATPAIVKDAPTQVPTDRITIKLSDDAGAPTIRVAIRGDRVDARIVTNDPVLARSLEQGASELSGTLQAQGFEESRVQVRGTAPAFEGKDLANVAGLASGAVRDAGTPQGDGESRSSGQHTPEQRSQQAFEERPRQEQGRQRRWQLDEEER